MIRTHELPWVAALLAATMAELAPLSAQACGGFYASEIEVAPDQKIVLVHRAGLETYIFRPRFCGAAKDFGLILPIPAIPSSAPALAENALYDQLDRYTEPSTEEICESSGFGCAGSDKASEAVGDEPGSFGTGVDVVDRGRVGIFDYEIVQAVSVNAFTDWLDANGYPHATYGSDLWSPPNPYQFYVDKGWYFVAFKVSADSSAPPAGKKLCGDLGPLQLSFPTAQPVVPARIASVNYGTSGQLPTWRVFLIASNQQKLETSGSFNSSRYFSKALHQSELADFGQLAAVSQEGERLTVLNVHFSYTDVGEDIAFELDPYPADFRSVRYVPKDCGQGCAVVGAMPMHLLSMAAALGALLLLRRRKLPAN
jgi:hypothetical protein